MILCLLSSEFGITYIHCLLEEVIRPCRVDLGRNEKTTLNDIKKHHERAKSFCGQYVSTDQQDAKNKPLGTERQQKCMLCNCSYTIGYKMVKHMHKKHAGLFIACKHNGRCTKIFRTEAEKSEHILELKKNNEKLEECNFCDKLYVQKHKISHLKIYHKNDNLIGCGYSRCFSYFRSEKEKQNHEALVHASTKKSKCIFCNLFYPAHTMLFHFRSMHKSLIPSAFKCKLNCRCYFLTEADLNEHIASVHNNYFMRQEVQCIYCNKIYSDKYTLRGHIENIHPMVKIRCRFRGCIQYFHTQNKADTHFVQQHKKIVNNKKFQCLKCNFRSASKGDYKHHISQMHGDFSIPCPKCSKRFRSSATLDTHLAVTHKPPKACPHCNRSYSFASLKFHLKQEKCKRCNKVLLCVLTAKLHKRVCKLQTDPGTFDVL
jgi:hypothetical protein